MPARRFKDVRVAIVTCISFSPLDPSSLSFKLALTSLEPLAVYANPFSLYSSLWYADLPGVFMHRFLRHMAQQLFSWIYSDYSCTSNIVTIFFSFHGVNVIEAINLNGCTVISALYSARTEICGRNPGPCCSTRKLLLKTFYKLFLVNLHHSECIKCLMIHGTDCRSIYVPLL